MLPPIVDCIDPATPDEIADIEDAAGFQTPDEFRSFLRNYNGGRLHPNAIRSSAGDTEYGPLEFYGTRKTACSRMSLIDVLDYVPEEYLPFASSPYGGDLICLRRTSASRIEVVRVIADPDRPERSVVIESSSFGEWLRSFRLKECTADQDADIFELCDDGCLSRLVFEMPNDWIDLRDRSGDHLIHIAVMNAQPKTVARLIALDSNVANQQGTFSSTPLHICGRSHSLDSCRYLIAAGAELNARDDDGRTPLMIAALFGSLRVGQQLVESGAEIHLKDHSGKTVEDYCDAGLRKDVLLRFIKEYAARDAKM